MPEHYIEKAISSGKSAIGFSEHYDYLYKENGKQVPLPDPQQYTDAIFALREKYKGKIKILCGLEAGYCKEASETYAELYEKYPFDYLINSVHMVNGQDCYHNTFSRGLTARQAYTLYFEQVLESMDVPYPFQVLGHLGYASRYTDFADKKIRYEDFSELIDEILKRCIRSGAALEINTSARGAGSLFLPDTDIVERYVELGGRKITFGSDAHSVERYCENENEVRSMLKNVGVNTVYYFEKKKPIAQSIEE